MFLISDAMANPAQAQAPGMEMFFMIAIFFLIMYFMIIRPQTKRQKEHKQLIESLSKGDEVVTSGGMMGKVKEVGTDSIRVEVADSVIIKFQKQAVNTVLPKGTLKEE